MSSRLSRAIEALGDPARREVLERLGEGPRTAAQLAASLMAPEPLLAEWLASLQGAGLVAERGSRQLPTYLINAKGVEELRDFLERIANLPSAELKGVPVDRRPDLPGGLTLRQEVTIPRSREHAFRRFSEHMGDWWPLGQWHQGTASPVTVVLELVPGGRWYERGDDGSEIDWGEVLVFEPARRLELSWRLPTADRAGAKLETEVDVHFTPVPPQECRVRVEHRLLNAGGEAAGQLLSALESESGWPLLLQRFADAG